MASVIPLLKSKNIKSDVLRYARNIATSDDIDAGVFSSYMRQLNELARVDVIGASVGKACLYLASGDEENFFKETRNIGLNGDRAQEAFLNLKWKVSYLDNKGLEPFVESLEKFRGAVNLANAVKDTFFLGKFSFAKRIIADSISRKEVLKGSWPDADKVLKVLDLAGVSEEHVSAMIAETGSLLRGLGYLAYGRSATLQILTEECDGPGISITYALEVSPEKAADINWLIAERMVETDLANPYVFLSVKGEKCQ